VISWCKSLLLDGHRKQDWGGGQELNTDFLLLLPYLFFASLQSKRGDPKMSQ